MGLKLSILAAIQLIALATAGHAEADNKKALAGQLFELAIEEYKAKQYDAAAASLAKSYALDPRPDSLYALAQAERLDGNCKDAVVHYQQLLDTAKDDKTKSAVKANIELCREIEAGETPAVVPVEDAKAVEQRDAPTIEIRTVVRTERKSDAVTIAAFAVGGTSLGGSVALFLMSRSTRSDADRATTLDDYNDLYDRSARLRWMSYAAAGLGVSLVSYAVVRLVTGGDDKTERPDVAIVPVRGGSIVSWSSSW